MVESPHSRELTANTAIPPMNTLLMAPPSATLPNISIRPAIIRKYTVTTQEVVPASVPKLSLISGSTTLTIVPSIPSRNIAAAITAMSIHCPLLSWITLDSSLVTTLSPLIRDRP